ncbi:hypothetical protein M2138_000637 [Dysgonomonadaceae bacterium PH5-43]|nr:hypothetical protein [Dysgonomonadaceae bacterium PH5-43]
MKNKTRHIKSVILIVLLTMIVNPSINAADKGNLFVAPSQQNTGYPLIGTDARALTYDSDRPQVTDQVGIIPVGDLEYWSLGFLLLGYALLIKKTKIVAPQQ